MIVTMNTKYKDIDGYIASFPKETQKILQQIRITIKKAAPEAVETIKYSMPTFTFRGNLIYFAAFKNPAPSADEAFNREISAYKGAKSSLRFPLDKPIPLELINKIVKFRIMENSR